MDCQYINQNEIYEKYLLGRLGDAEKKEYEAHLQGCETCRKTLETQREMIAVIRLKAKQDMKREIQLQAGKLREQRPKQDWAVWYKAAAVILLFSVAPALLYYYLHTGTIPMQNKMVLETEQIEEQQDALPPAAPAARAVPGHEKKKSIRRRSYSAQEAPTSEKAFVEKSTSAAEKFDAVQRRAKRQAMKGESAAAGSEMAEDDFGTLNEIDRMILSGKAAGANKMRLESAASAMSLRQDSVKIYRLTTSAPVRAKKKTAYAATAVSGEKVWRFASGESKIEILLPRALADSLKKKNALPEIIEYRILQKNGQLLRMRWQGRGAYKKTGAAEPVTLRRYARILEIVLQDSIRYRFHLNRDEGRAARIR